MSAMSDFITVCEKAVRAGGAVLLDKMGRVTAREKGRADLVTEADFASQEVIRRMLLEAFPDHAFLGEEDEPGKAGGPEGAEYRWIVDPLDGTTNYVHQVPHFSVSLALERSGELVVGGVYDPVADECFLAVAGEGARLNGRPIRTSSVVSLSEALTAVGFPAVVTDGSSDLKLFLAALAACQAIRRTGSAALNMCYVAAGRFDASWSFCTKIWDIAAGVLLIREAGGAVTSPEGGPLVLASGRYVAAANRQLYAEVCALVSQANP